MRKRNIRISIELAKEACGDKLREEAFAFTLSLKFMYVSSALKGRNLTKKHLKTLFKIGDAKLTRILNNAEDFGYIRFEKGLIIANSLVRDDKLTYVIKVDRKLLLNKDAIKIIRHAIAAKHIGNITRYHDLYKRQSEPKTIGDVKMMRGKPKYYSTGVSNARMAEVLKCKVWKARQIMSELTKNGTFTKEEQYKPFLTDAGNPITKLSMCGWRQLASEGIILKRRNGIFVEQLPNLYLLDRKRAIRYYDSSVN